MRVAADDEIGLDAANERRDGLLGGSLEEDIRVVLRGGVAEQHAADALDLQLEPLRQRVQERDLLLRVLVSHPADHVGGRQPLLAGRQLPVGVAANPAARARREPATARASLRASGPAVTSPPTTIAASSGISASTASSAGRFPCTS